MIDQPAPTTVVSVNARHVTNAGVVAFITERIDSRVTFKSSHLEPRSCDLLGLVRAESASPAGDEESADAGLFLVWLIDDRDTVVVRAAASLSAVIEAARAYTAGWGGELRYVEGPDGQIVPRALWEPLMQLDDPLPYVYTVELRSPRGAGLLELVTALWTSADLDEAVRWRTLLPAALRSRTLVVSNAPDGHYPRRRY